MRYKGEDYVKFESTGRSAYAFGGVIGISERDVNSISVVAGYDNRFPLHSEDELTKEERQELANYMISLWTQFKESSTKKERDGDERQVR